MRITLLWFTRIAWGEVFSCDLWSQTILSKDNGTTRACKIFGTEDHPVDPDEFKRLPEYQKQGILSCAQQCEISEEISYFERLMRLKSSFVMAHVARCLQNGAQWNKTTEKKFDNKNATIMGCVHYDVYDFPPHGVSLSSWWGGVARQFDLSAAEYVLCIQTLMRQLYGRLKFFLDCKAEFNISFILHDLSRDSLVLPWLGLPSQKDENFRIWLESLTLTLQDVGSMMKIDGSDEIPARTKASLGSVPVWPPEVNHFAERVAASLPLHSYDIFCAMLLMLAFAKSRSELLYPDALIGWWYMSNLKLLLNPQSLKRLSACIDRPVKAETASKCVNLHAWLAYRESFAQHLRSHRQSKDREKSLALLMMCSFKRAFWLDYATGLSGWKPADKNYISPRSKEAMLLTNWVRRGFDDLIWRSLSADPTERPLPSEILTSLWFTNESLVLEEGSTLQFTCPYMETPPGIVSLFFSLLVFLCMGIATVVLGLHEIIVKIKAGQSMSPYVWEPVGGIYIICSSLCVMAWLDYGLIYWVIMAPLGLFTMLGSTLEIFKDWQTKQWLLIAALLGCCLQSFGAYYVADSLRHVMSMFQHFKTWKQDPNFQAATRGFEGYLEQQGSVALQWLCLSEIMLYVSPLLPIAVLTYNFKIHRDMRQSAASTR